MMPPSPPTSSAPPATCARRRSARAKRCWWDSARRLMGGCWANERHQRALANNMIQTPSFDEALALFRNFVVEQGFSAELEWVFREDVTNCRRNYWVHVPVPKANTELTRRHFEIGQRRGLGVTLEVLCRLRGRSACFVWWPEDEEAASYAMQGPLKMKVPIEPVDATP